jgi:hypothetical protein
VIRVQAGMPTMLRLLRQSSKIDGHHLLPGVLPEDHPDDVTHRMTRNPVDQGGLWRAVRVGVSLLLQVEAQ